MIKYLITILVGASVLTGCSLFSGNVNQSAGPISIKSAKNGQFQLSEVALNKPGFIIFYADNGAGQPGRVVGQSNLLAQGTINDVKVGSSKIEKGQTYYAMLHYDNGDQKFLIANDRPATDEQGKPIIAQVVAK